MTKDDIIQAADAHGDLLVNDAGDWVYWSSLDESGGYLTAWVLRALADELDRRNGKTTNNQGDQ